MKEINNLTVKYHDRVVGILAETKDGKSAFQYEKEWLTSGFSISPFSLPLNEEVFVAKKDTFEGLFGVFAHNRDDHSKNFSYIYDENDKRWMLSPAYDLTYSNSIGGEHATCINGNGKNPRKEDLIEVGKRVGISEKKAKKLASEIEETVKTELEDILSLSK